jgi:altronate hydrolase
MTKDWLQIDARDNVLVALTDLEPLDIVFGDQLIPIKQPVPQKHKFLITDLRQGEKIIMYGVQIGTVNSDLPRGTLITTANVTHFAAEVNLNNEQPPAWQAPDVLKFKGRTFEGYHRPDGRVGTANYWLVVPLVFCENRNLKVLEEALTKGLGYYRPNQYEAYVRNKVAAATFESTGPTGDKVFERIDGIKFLYHQGGCGGTRQDSESLLRLLAGYINHPNVAGATVLSLGCQHAQISWYKEIQQELYKDTGKPVIYLEQQQMNSEEELITSALDQTISAMQDANKISRKPAGLEKLVVGLECGGSDGFSGISANPAVGHASDMVVALGGATILSEFPELNGVEQDLVDRCMSAGTAEKFISLQRAYEAQARALGSGFAMNPSPGNIRDGLITDAMKSAGAAKKGGTAPVADVLDYTEVVTKPGLNLLCTPGNDVESTTGLAGSGANIILFTTGLGTPTGNPITPVIKISSNTSLSNKMSDLIDLDAGPVIEGKKTIQETGEELLELIIEVAGGKATKAMELEQNDFIPWKRGVSL